MQSKTFHLSQWDPILFLELCQCYDNVIRRSPEIVSDDKKKEIASEILNLNVCFNL